MKEVVTIIFVLSVFWNMISSYEGGNLGDISNEENETGFTVIKTDTWYIIVNNYGQMKDGVFPS